ncbi:hypothetical protein PG996_006133 [Apiospora saccharicola]|uniref:Nephrocystin 3-like N-terminal domain-containing protein n=1 Tax=Apiospora saccharicola TaxID=335842 RepID=A0ABR1VRF9_9PEZI
MSSTTTPVIASTPAPSSTTSTSTTASTRVQRRVRQGQAMAEFTHALWDPTEEEFTELLDRLQPFCELLAARLPGSGLSFPAMEVACQYLCRWRGAIGGISRALQRGKDKHMADTKMIWHVETEQHLDTYGFVLKHELYTQWAATPESALLSIGGPAASGKTIIAGLIHEALRTSPGIKGVYSFVNCCPQRSTTPTDILQAVLWSMFAQRPDTAMDASRGEGEWLELLSRADSIDAYWVIFVKLARHVNTVWLVLDSIHDCSGDIQGLLGRFAGVAANPDIGFTLKLVVTTRDHGILGNRLEAASRLTYTAEDLDVDWSIYKAIGELNPSGVVDPGRVLPAAIAAVQRMGGGLFWARAVLSQVRGKDARSSKAAIKYFEKLQDHEQLDSQLVARLMRDQARRHFVLAVVAVLIDSSTPVSAHEILARLAGQGDDKCEGGRTATVEDVETVLTDDTLGLFRSFNGNWVVPSRFLRACDATATAALRRTVRKKTAASVSVAAPARGGSLLLCIAALACLLVLVGSLGATVWHVI